jgi:hypothetical protein
MTETDRTKAHCSSCGPDRWADIICEHKTTYADSDVWGDTRYQVLQCRGCDEVFFQEIQVFSEDGDWAEDPDTGREGFMLRPKVTRWPPPMAREQPGWLHEVSNQKLTDILEELYVSLNNNTPILSAIGIRTSFDVVCSQLSIDEAATFKVKVEELVSRGMISSSEGESLHVLTDAGSAAAHRGWQPSTEAITTMVGILEAMIERLIVAPVRAARLKMETPQKKPRTSKSPKE